MSYQRVEKGISLRHVLGMEDSLVVAGTTQDIHASYIPIAYRIKKNDLIVDK